MDNIPCINYPKENEERGNSKTKKKGFIKVSFAILERIMVENPIIIRIKRTTNAKLTLILVNPSNMHNLILETFVVILSLPLGAMDLLKILHFQTLILCNHSIFDYM
jgi:hypothetical protein